MDNIIENLIIIYTVDEGTLKILLKKKLEEPYKGYWILPGEVLDNETTLEESTTRLFETETSLSPNNIRQGRIFSNIDRNPDNRVIAVANIIITDKNLVDMKNKPNEVEWFEVNNLPKLGFDHKDIIDEVTKETKEKIECNYSDIILDFFPSDFTLPEFQKFYETMLDKNIDRRNFRKKILNQDLVIDTGEKVVHGTGRPGTLYRFNKKNMKGKKL